VTYVSVPDRALWRSRVDGSERMQLTAPGKITAGLPRWSPDGKQIVFMGRTLNANWRACLISANGGQWEDLAPEAAAGVDPGWTPDGKSIVLSMNNLGPAGRGISILDLQTRKGERLARCGAFFSPRVSPDGKFIAAISGDEKGLMLYDVAAQKWTELIRMQVGYPSWSHSGQYVYFDSFFSDDPGFYRIRISDRKLERLVSLSDIRRVLGTAGRMGGARSGRFTANHPRRQQRRGLRHRLAAAIKAIGKVSSRWAGSANNRTYAALLTSLAKLNVSGAATAGGVSPAPTKARGRQEGGVKPPLQILSVHEDSKLFLGREKPGLLVLPRTSPSICEPRPNSPHCASTHLAVLTSLVKPKVPAFPVPEQFRIFMNRKNL